MITEQQKQFNSLPRRERELLLSQIGNYIVLHCHEEDPREVCAEFVKCAHLHSLDAEHLAYVVSVKKSFGVPIEMWKEVEKEVVDCSLYEDVKKAFKHARKRRLTTEPKKVQEALQEVSSAD